MLTSALFQADTPFNVAQSFPLQEVVKYADMCVVIEFSAPDCLRRLLTLSSSS